MSTLQGQFCISNIVYNFLLKNFDKIIAFFFRMEYSVVG